jgi:hypothetical protein
MTFIVDGTNGLTFPNSTTQASSGVVLQVVSATTNSTSSTTSTSFVASNLAVTITPKFSTSKILVLCGVSITNTTNGGIAYATIYRGSSTNLAGGTNALSYYSMVGSTYVWIPSSICVIDSPATTSATTYTAYFSSGGSSTAYINNSGSVSTITVMEIAG